MSVDKMPVAGDVAPAPHQLPGGTGKRSLRRGPLPVVVETAVILLLWELAVSVLGVIDSTWCRRRPWYQEDAVQVS